MHRAAQPVPLRGLVASRQRQPAARSAGRGAVAQQHPVARIGDAVERAGTAVELGMIVVGDYRSLLDEAEWGGTEQGARAEPVTYSYIKTEDDGTVTIKRRHAATSMRAGPVLKSAIGASVSA